MLTSDVFRDNALTTVLEHGVLPNVGSPGMVRDLRDAGYRGPIALRANPGFGHGHVQAVDTGGPSSKHGVWHEDLTEARRLAAEARLPIVALHVHVGTGPGVGEFDANMRKLIDFYESVLPEFPDAVSVNFGGGLPHAYRPGAPVYDLASYRPILLEAAERLRRAAQKPVRIEIEPGRYPVAGMGLLVCRVKDIKSTRANSKGPGHTFVMVDAGFNDLVRPAMYGSYHHISIVGAGASRPPEPLVVAGPLCESGDVFTRDDHELLDPRSLPRPEPGDLLVLHDAGAYGASMSSNYVSLGRAAAGILGRGQGHADRPARDHRRRHPDRVRRVDLGVVVGPSQLLADFIGRSTRSLMLRNSTGLSWSCRSMWPFVALPKLGNPLNLLAATFSFQSSLPLS